MHSETPQPQGEDTEGKHLTGSLSPVRETSPHLQQSLKAVGKEQSPPLWGSHSLKHKDKCPSLVTWDPPLLLHLSLGGTPAPAQLQLQGRQQTDINNAEISQRLKIKLPHGPASPPGINELTASEQPAE